MNISKKLGEVLCREDIKPYILAKETGISQNNLYKILSGENSNPTIRIVKKIADYLNVRVDDLL